MSVITTERVGGSSVLLGPPAKLLEFPVARIDSASHMTFFGSKIELELFSRTSFDRSE